MDKQKQATLEHFKQNLLKTKLKIEFIENDKKNAVSIYFKTRKGKLITSHYFIVNEIWDNNYTLALYFSNGVINTYNAITKK